MKVKIPPKEKRRLAMEYAKSAQYRFMIQSEDIVEQIADDFLAGMNKSIEVIERMNEEKK